MTEGERYPELVAVLRNRVAQGAEFLDETVPKWESLVVLRSLSIQSPCNCVLGQVWGIPMGFSAGRFALHAWLQEQGAATAEAEEFGFDLDNGLVDDYGVPTESYWDILLEEWKILIHQRRADG